MKYTAADVISAINVLIEDESIIHTIDSFENFDIIKDELSHGQRVAVACRRIDLENHKKDLVRIHNRLAFDPDASLAPEDEAVLVRYINMGFGGIDTDYVDMYGFNPYTIFVCRSSAIYRNRGYAVTGLIDGDGRMVSIPGCLVNWFNANVDDPGVRT